MKKLSEMTEADLVKEIEIHNEAYWEKGEPIISDIAYDALVESLRNKNPDHPLVNKVHTPSVSSDGKVTHKLPMRSLDKVYSIEELIKWCIKVARNERELFNIEYKFDGVSADLSNGILATRGDGIIGENISSKLPIINVMRRVPNARGEIVMLKDVFERLKDTLEFKNTRNAVGGLLNRDDVDISYGKILTLVNFDEIQFPFTLTEIMAFTTDPKPFEDIIKVAGMSNFPTDGLVIKLQDQLYAKSLGATSHHAKGEIAFKFANPTGETVLEGIEWSMGKHVITPIGKVKPVEISGVTISNVNLHNLGYIIKNDIHIGDTIIVERAGDVIPDVHKVIPGMCRVVITLEKCPSCGGEVVYNDPIIICKNEECPGKHLHRLMDSVVRIGIERLGLPTLRKMVETLEVKNLIDIVALTPTQINTLEGFGARSSVNLYREIQKVCENPVDDWRILSCLNLVGIGTSLSKTLLEQFSFDELRGMSIESLKDVEGIGSERASILAHGLVSNSRYIDILLDVLTVRSSKTSGTNTEKKIKICFTGKFPQKKSYYYKLLGPEYEVVERIGSDTNVLVVANPSVESNKTKSAKKKGISIVGLYDLFDKQLLDMEG